MRFRAGDFSLDNAPQLGRPVEDDSDKIKKLIENNQCYTTQEIADILKISISIKLLVKMKNVSFILWKKPYRLFVQPNAKTGNPSPSLRARTSSEHASVLNFSTVFFPGSLLCVKYSLAYQSADFILSSISKYLH